MSSPVKFTEFYNIVGNEKHSVAEETYHGINPSNSKPLWETPVTTKKDLNDTVSVGNTAFKKWSMLPHSERSRLVKEYADSLQEYTKDFTELLVRETDKPPPFATGGHNRYHDYEG